MSGYKVMKFGGTSVHSPEARNRAALAILSARESGFRPVVVVSAIGRRGEPYATDTLRALLDDLDPATEPDARELDLVMACGEILSASIFATLLKSMGCPAISLRGGQAGIRTDGVYGNARIRGVNPLGVVEACERGYVPIVCGFQGVWIQGGLPGAELTTLGRGGSDTTAAALGAALRASAIEIYTDVDGVKSADPNIVTDAPTLRRVTYDEVAELAHLGAKVLHPRAAEIAMKHDIPLWVKSTFEDAPGTQIVSNRELPGRRVTGVTHSGKLVYLQVDISAADASHRRELQARIYEALARYQVNLYMTNMGPSSLGFAVLRDKYAEVQDMLDALVLPVPGNTPTVYLLQSSNDASRAFETQRKFLEPLGEVRELRFRVTEGTTMISLAAYDYLNQAGVFAKVLSLFHAHGISVLQTSDSDYSLSCLISESDLRPAVALLHQEFCSHETSP